MGDVTTKDEVIQSFHSHPMEKKELPEGLEDEWFVSALSQYELEIDTLEYDFDTNKFNDKLNNAVIYTLGLIMYQEYLTRELSRTLKINGFRGRDVQMTGSDTAKRMTYSELQNEINRVQELLHKQKTHAFS